VHTVSERDDAALLRAIVLGNVIFDECVGTGIGTSHWLYMSVCITHTITLSLNWSVRDYAHKILSPSLYNGWSVTIAPISPIITNIHWNVMSCELNDSIDRIQWHEPKSPYILFVWIKNPIFLDSWKWEVSKYNKSHSCVDNQLVIKCRLYSLLCTFQSPAPWLLLRIYVSSLALQAITGFLNSCPYLYIIITQV